MISTSSSSSSTTTTTTTTSSSCLGCAKAEPQIRALLDYISVAFFQDPSQLLGFDLSKSSDPLALDFSAHLIKKMDSNPEFPLCPDLKKRIEGLVTKLVSESMASESSEGGNSVGERKRRRDGGDDGEGLLVEMLRVLRCVGMDPSCGKEMGAHCWWKKMVLQARKVLFVRTADVSDAPEFPYKKKQKFLCSPNGGPGSSHISNNPRRRSQRTLLKFGNSEIPRKRIPVGPFFQADVPEFTNPPIYRASLNGIDDLDDSRWLGTQIWPINSFTELTNDKKIGQRIPSSCQCSLPGSVECVRFHVNAARRYLKSDLGPAFVTLGFDKMGEEVSKSWTQEEQMRFDDFVRQNATSEGKSFLEPALKYFTSKTKQEVVSFYFNVFLLRWMSMRTRLGTCPVDSSDDENVGWE